MTERKRYKQTMSLQERVALFAQGARERVDLLPDGAERDDMLERARKADMALSSDWLRGGQLQR